MRAELDGVDVTEDPLEENDPVLSATLLVYPKADSSYPEAAHALAMDSKSVG